MKRLSTLVLLAATLLVSACGGVQFKGASVSVGYGTPGVYGQPYYRRPTHVYPNGVNLHQYAGQRVYHGGHESASTCYVDCFHQGY